MTENNGGLPDRESGRKKSSDDSRTTIPWEQFGDFMRELRDMARDFLKHEKRAWWPNTDSLVDKAVLKQHLTDVNWAEVTWENRDRFLGAACNAMRWALRDRARYMNRRRRIKTVQLVDMRLDDLVGTGTKTPELLGALTEALDELEKRYPKEWRIVQHRYFVGCRIEEIARIMNLSVRAVRRKLRAAEALLRDEMELIVGPDTERRRENHAEACRQPMGQVSRTD